MKQRILFLLALVAITALAGCAKYDEENDCYQQPSWRVCDTYDVAPTEAELTVHLDCDDTYPVTVEIYNRTILFGVGSLHTTLQQNSANESYTLPMGRYTAFVTFDNDSTVQADFRLHNTVNEYCEGTCYEINDDSVLLTEPQ